MKRIITLALALAVVFGSVCVAKAVDVKIKGQWDWGIGFYDNKNFYDKDQDNATDDAFAARQRLRTQIDIVASEALSGTVMFEIGTIYWGRNPSGNTSGRGSGGALDADGVNVETKRAYLDWIVPETDLSIRMGIQGFFLPSATGFGSPVYSGDGAGVVANYKFNNMVSATLFWMRPFDYYTVDNGDGNRSLDDETDMIGLMLPLSFDGMKITPWASYARIGGASGYWGFRAGNQSDAGFNNGFTGAGDNTFEGSTNAWWAGLAFDLSMFDPLSFRMDVMYGYMSGQAQTEYARNAAASGIFQSNTNPGGDGWFLDAIVEYKLDWGTPGLFGWYSSGDDWDDVKDGEFGRMPMIGSDNGFGATGFGMSSSAVPGWGYDKAVSRTGIGTWGVGVQIADMRFVESLSHTLRFAYYRGTNDSDIIDNLGGSNPGSFSRAYSNFGEMLYLTDKDAAYEINFVTKYQVYENMAIFLDAAWVHLDLDDVWKENAADLYGDDTTDSWKAELLFQYKF